MSKELEGVRPFSALRSVAATGGRSEMRASVETSPAEHRPGPGTQGSSAAKGPDRSGTPRFQLMGPTILRVIIHCWAIESRLLTNQ